MRPAVPAALMKTLVAMSLGVVPSRYKLAKQKAPAAMSIGVVASPQELAKKALAAILQGSPATRRGRSGGQKIEAQRGAAALCC